MTGGEDVEFPPTVQEELREAFAREKQELLAKLEDINTEKENSQQVNLMSFFHFDTNDWRFIGVRQVPRAGQGVPDEDGHGPAAGAGQGGPDGGGRQGAHCVAFIVRQ
jgi:hypothetical protein